MQLHRPPAKPVIYAASTLPKILSFFQLDKLSLVLFLAHIKNLKINEKKINRTFVKNENIKDNIEKESERSEDYGNNIQTGRRLSNSEFNVGENERESISGQILSNEVTLSEGTQKRTIYGFNDEKKLTEHLQEVQETATKRLNQIIQEMMKKEQITEELKIKDQMTWVQMMNNIKNSAEEIILQEIIYN